MKTIIGQRVPRGTARGTISGCGCSGGVTPNPGPQLRYGQRYGGTNAQVICYRGTNGQLVCPSGSMNMRARGGTSRFGPTSQIADAIWISRHGTCYPDGECI